MSVKFDNEKILDAIKKLINKMNLDYFMTYELNEINLLLMKLIMFSEEKREKKN
jgi:hypothetical protein